MPVEMGVLKVCFLEYVPTSVLLDDQQLWGRVQQSVFEQAHPSLRITDAEENSQQMFPVP